LFSFKNKNEVLGEINKNLIQEMYGKPKSILYNSKTVKTTVKESPNKHGKVSFIFKRKYFGEN